MERDNLSTSELEKMGIPYPLSLPLLEGQTGPHPFQGERPCKVLEAPIQSFSVTAMCATNLDGAMGGLKCQGQEMEQSI